MNEQAPVKPTTTQFTPSELRALRGLRQKYRTIQHLFTPGETVHLEFLRWLYENERLAA